MGQHRLGRQARQPLALGAEGDQRHADTGGARGLRSVSVSPTRNDARPRPGLVHGGQIGAGSGLRTGSVSAPIIAAKRSRMPSSLRSRVSASAAGLLVADGKDVAIGQAAKRGFGAGVKPGMDGNAGRVMVKQAGIVLVLGTGGSRVSAGRRAYSPRAASPGRRERRSAHPRPGPAVPQARAPEKQAFAAAIRSAEVSASVPSRSKTTVPAISL